MAKNTFFGKELVITWSEVAKMAETYKMEADNVKEMLGEAGKKQIMDDLAVAKAVEFVVAQAEEVEA